MDKSITTALFIVISMILALMLFNVAYPAVQESSDAIANLASRADDRMRTQIEIIHVAAELNSSGNWQEANPNGDFEVFVWVKNIGGTRITGLEQVDVFFGPEGNFARIPMRASELDPRPNWTWQIENASEWTPTATMRLTLHFGGSALTSGHFIRVTLPNGISDYDYIGL
jgi:hypothetical protein